MESSMSSAGTSEVIIPARFNGPPASANGGYASGVLARGLSSAVVTLRAPPPLDRPLALVPEESGGRLLDGEQLIAQVQQAELELEVPAPVSFAEAEAASRRYPGFESHGFPTCFVCGPRRAPGDGLRIFPGQVGEQALNAAPWQPDASLAGADGLVAEQFVWAALDCPGAFALYLGRAPGKMLLGRMQAQVLAPVRVGERYVVMGWPLGRDGRKQFAGTAVFTADGELIAKAQAPNEC
jgi:hypothetical protein